MEGHRTLRNSEELEYSQSGNAPEGSRRIEWTEEEGLGSGRKVLEGFGRPLDPHLACGKAPAQPHVFSIKAGPLWPRERTSLPSAEDRLCCTGFPGVPRYWCLVQLSRFLGSLSLDRKSVV